MSQPSQRQLRIVKLGGSLLDLADLAERLRRWLAAQSAAANVVVVGGGRFADVVRDYDRLHHLPPSDAHWLAIRAMRLNARLVASLLPEAEWLEALPALGEAAAPLAILDPWSFLRADDAGERLPATWQVTSDSIAARLAALSRASELVLLKSAPPPEPATVEAAVAAGYVDAMFAQASRRLPCIRCVDLRAAASVNHLLAIDV